MEYFLRLISLNKDTCINFRCHFANDDGKRQKINVIHKQFVLLTFVTSLKNSTIDKIDKYFYEMYICQICQLCNCNCHLLNCKL
jgi:hypothetical protein